VSSIDAFVFDGAFVALTLAVLPPSHVHGIRIRTDSRTEAETVTVMINDPLLLMTTHSPRRFVFFCLSICASLVMNYVVQHMTRVIR
jgi:hypothetical protein